MLNKGACLNLFSPVFSKSFTSGLSLFVLVILVTWSHFLPKLAWDCDPILCFPQMLGQ
jgi:hypothetical protein